MHEHGALKAEVCTTTMTSSRSRRERRCLVLMAKRRARGRRQPVLEAAERILRVDPLHRNARRARADLERLARTTGANKKLPNTKDKSVTKAGQLQVRSEQ